MCPVSCAKPRPGSTVSSIPFQDFPPSSHVLLLQKAKPPRLCGGPLIPNQGNGVPPYSPPAVRICPCFQSNFTDSILLSDPNTCAMPFAKKTPRPIMWPGQLAGINQLDQPARLWYHSCLRIPGNTPMNVMMPSGPPIATLMPIVAPIMAPSAAPSHPSVANPITAPIAAPASMSQPAVPISHATTTIAATTAITTTIPARICPSVLQKLSPVGST